jgi:hypothetical protein
MSPNIGGYMNKSIDITLNPMQVGVVKRALARELDDIKSRDDISAAERAAWVVEVETVQDMLAN